MLLDEVEQKVHGTFEYLELDMIGHAVRPFADGYQTLAFFPGNVKRKQARAGHAGKGTGRSQRSLSPRQAPV
jgi:hypothetical protein